MTLTLFAQPPPVADTDAEGDEFYTPRRVLVPARAVLGVIHLDPSSCHAANVLVQASAFYSIHEDGLRQPWSGNVWINPPYSDAAPWAAKLLDELDAGRVHAACWLSYAKTETRWFQSLAHAADARCDLRGRLTHIPGPGVVTQRAGGKGKHGSTVLYFGPRADLFRMHFAPEGLVYSRHGVEVQP